MSKLIYLDHAAATPVHGAVARAMTPFFTKDFGNPSSLYKLGIAAKKALEESRKSIAEFLNARPEEVIFTGGGTESINMALLGAARVQNRINSKSRGHIITSSIEHHAVLHTLDQLKTEGFTVTQIPVNAKGLLDIKKFKAAIRPDTFLVSVMYANNEIGTVEPIREIAGIIRKENHNRKNNSQIRK